MVYFIEAVILIGLIVFPIIMLFFKGVVEYAFYWGIVFGMHYDKMYFQTKDKKGNKENYKLHMIQFHILCVTILLTFSRKAKNIIVEDDE